MLLYHIISQSPPAAKRQVMPSGKACLLQQGGEKPWICIDTETSSLLSCAGHVVRLWLQNVQQMGWAMVWITWHTLQTYPQVLVETLWGNLAEMLPEEFIEISLGSLKLKKAWRLQHDFNMSTVFQGSSILQTIRIIQNISEPTDFNHVPGPILLESHFVGKSRPHPTWSNLRCGCWPTLGPPSGPYTHLVTLRGPLALSPYLYLLRTTIQTRWVQIPMYVIVNI